MAAGGFALGSAKTANAQTAQSEDTPTEILTAFLIAEDLATTFYYNGLVGPVIQDPNLAGPGGSPGHISASDNAGNVNYLQAALTEEISHASLMRQSLGLSQPSSDPAQTFYFPPNTFTTLANFTTVLNLLEITFIGAYLNAIQELALMAANARVNGNMGGSGSSFTPAQLEYFAEVAASILGIECEHRVLGRVISNTNPANNLAYEQTGGITAFYNGTSSAVAALTPFLTASTGRLTAWRPRSPTRLRSRCRSRAFRPFTRPARAALARAERNKEAAYSVQRLKISDPLVPPKPKEFERAYSRAASCGLPGT